VRKHAPPPTPPPTSRVLLSEGFRWREARAVCAVSGRRMGGRGAALDRGDGGGGGAFLFRGAGGLFFRTVRKGVGEIC